MLRQNTLLVLGAGSSVDFGFPVGTKLAEQIAGSLNDTAFSHNHRFDQTKSVDLTQLPLATVIFNGSGRDRELVRKNAGLISRDIELAGSVDAYLGNKADDALLVKIGKMAIVEQIVLAERKSGVYVGADLDIGRSLEAAPGSPKAISGFWMERLLGVLLADLTPEQQPDIFSRLKVMSFNYDRLLEHYLFNRIRQYMDLHYSGAVELMATLDVSRPYGRIGPLPWQRDKREEAVPFGGRCRLEEAASSIRTFTEQKGETELVPFHDQVTWADQVIFLGFGFLRQNLAFMVASPDKAKNRAALGTALYMSKPNQDVVTKTLGGVAVSQKVELAELDCSAFLDAYRFRITS